MPYASPDIASITRRALYLAIGATLLLALAACGDDDSAAYPPATATVTPTPPTNSLEYDFGGIEGAASAVQSSVQMIQSLLDEGGRCVQKLATIWGGSGSDAYQQTQQRWDSTAAALNAALKDLSDKVGQAGAGMQDTENHIGGMFSYAFGYGPMTIRLDQMTTDAQALSEAATSFDRISSDLKSALGQVDSTAGDLASALHGPAGDAAQQAFVRYREAASKQIYELNTISENINRAGVQYQQAADDAASALQSSMGF
jgi:early secretory antigenic target protein ESAT-6